MSQINTPSMADEMDQVVHHLPTRKKRKMAPAKMTLNLTSMIDVIFLLLIYFVVTANFTPGEGILTAKLPQGTGSGNAVKLPPRPLVVNVTAVNTWGCAIDIQGYGPVSDFEELFVKLANLQYDASRGRTQGSHKPDDPIIIEPKRDVRWQHVVNAFNAAIRARYTNIAFAQTQK